MSPSNRVRLLRASGVLLLLLGIVHLAATPHISTLIRHSTSPSAADQLTPPMLLNHVLVGVLLLPLGYMTLYAAPYSANGVAWAKVLGTHHCCHGCSIAPNIVRADGRPLLSGTAICAWFRSSGSRVGDVAGGCVQFAA